jgi:hypothetical protein
VRRFGALNVEGTIDEATAPAHFAAALRSPSGASGPWRKQSLTFSNIIFLLIPWSPATRS